MACSTGDCQNLCFFLKDKKKNGLSEMHLGVYGVFCIIIFLFLMFLCDPVFKSISLDKRRGWNSENMFFVIFSSKLKLICCYANRGDEVSMSHFKEIDFLYWKT